uniref:Uncharacterized protein n=1 Tax=Arundo donax TaxID=35708 RepID=A0A0A9B1R4_ARUDO
MPSLTIKILDLGMYSLRFRMLVCCLSAYFVFSSCKTKLKLQNRLRKAGIVHTTPMQLILAVLTSYKYDRREVYIW